MYFLSAVSVALAFITLSSRAMPLPQDAYPADNYVPLTTYEAFESPPPLDTLRSLAVELNVKPADLYALSVFYTYDTLSAPDKAALTAQRALNSTIDAEINLCLWTIPGDCWPLWSNGHRREIQRGWDFLRKNGEKDYDTRMEYVSKGQEVAAGWARIVQSKEQQWRLAARSEKRSE